jgi:predicted metal-binding protein
MLTFNHIIVPKFGTDLPSPALTDITALRKCSLNSLVRLYKSVYDTEPKMVDRGNIIRRLQLLHLPQPATNPAHVTKVLTAKANELQPLIPKQALHTIYIPYEPASGFYLWLRADIFYMDRSEVILMEPYNRFAFCGNCKGSSGGCPTYSPGFEQLKPSCDKFFLIVLTCDFKWVFKNVWKERSQSYKNATLMFLMYPDRMTDRYLTRILLSLKQQDLGYPLFCGNCNGCNPRDCTVNQANQLCCKPERRTFSMESVGIDCDAFHKELYNEWLPWFFAGTMMMPTYIARYAGIITSKSSSELIEKLTTAIQKDKSYNPEIPPYTFIDPDIKFSVQTIPAWIHSGDIQAVYCLK